MSFSNRSKYDENKHNNYVVYVIGVNLFIYGGGSSKFSRPILVHLSKTTENDFLIDTQKLDKFFLITCLKLSFMVIAHFMPCFGER